VNSELALTYSEKIEGGIFVKYLRSILKEKLRTKQKLSVKGMMSKNFQNIMKDNPVVVKPDAED
jgi:hypothetical protein